MREGKVLAREDLHSLTHSRCERIIMMIMTKTNSKKTWRRELFDGEKNLDRQSNRPVRGGGGSLPKTTL